MKINIHKTFKKQFITTTSVGKEIFEIIMKDPESKNDVILLQLDFEGVYGFTSVPFNTLKGLIHSVGSKQSVRIELLNANQAITDSFKFAYGIEGIE